MRFEIGQIEIPWVAHFGVNANQREHTTTRSAGRDTSQPPRRFIRKICWEVGDDEHLERLGHFARVFVVFLNRGELVAQILLNHVFHMLGQVRETLIDVIRFGPDATGHKPLVVIGQVHEAGKVLTQPGGVDDRKAHFAGGQRRQHAEHRALKDPHRLVASRSFGFD